MFDLAASGASVREEAGVSGFPCGNYGEFPIPRYIEWLLLSEVPLTLTDMSQVILATAPLCTTKTSYLVNRILLGLFGSPVESLGEISITDIVRTPLMTRDQFVEVADQT